MDVHVVDEVRQQKMEAEERGAQEEVVHRVDVHLAERRHDEKQMPLSIRGELGLTERLSGKKDG